MDKGGAKLLLQEGMRRPFQGQRLLTLGRQDINFTYDLLEKAAKELGARLCHPDPITLSHQATAALQGKISDDSFFKALGFSSVAALDYSSFESARHIFDLNSEAVAENLVGSFDVIIDGGTIEHVFHIPNALNNIHEMLSKNGRIVHMSPSSNHIDHGFYMFSPTLFWDFYKTNGYEINTFQVFRYTQRPSIDAWEISEYKPGCLNAVSFGGLDDGMYGIFCVATKTKDSTGDRIPQQGLYLRAWGIGAEAESTTQTTASNLQSIKDLIRRIPAAPQILRYVRGITRKKGLGLKIIARY